MRRVLVGLLSGVEAALGLLGGVTGRAQAALELSALGLLAGSVRLLLRALGRLSLGGLALAAVGRALLGLVLLLGGPRLARRGHEGTLRPGPARLGLGHEPPGLEQLAQLLVARHRVQERAQAVGGVTRERTQLRSSLEQVLHRGALRRRRLAQRLA